MNILVCGGAGYIGSHMARWLAEYGHEVTVLDNLSTGHREAVRWGKLVEADLMDLDSLDQTFTKRAFDVVMHFCARSLVGESMANPYLYYSNNVTGTINLLETMRRTGSTVLFSHQLRRYLATQLPTESMKVIRNPQSTRMGGSKLFVERMLEDAAVAYGLRSVSLRYFNAAGASSDALIGESHHPETHLVPNVLRAAAGTGPCLKVFGDDYPTVDGTCVRDYVHVEDLAQAHHLALGLLNQNSGAHFFNLGNGNGFSVKEVIETAARVVGRKLSFDVASRRPGDPPVLVASSIKAQEELGWHPRHSELSSIIESAWRWHRDPRF